MRMTGSILLFAKYRLGRSRSQLDKLQVPRECAVVNRAGRKFQMA